MGGLRVCRRPTPWWGRRPPSGCQGALGDQLFGAAGGHVGRVGGGCLVVGALLVELAVLHDVVQAVVVLEDGDVGERVAVDEQQVGEVARLHLPQLVGPQHDLPAQRGGGEDRLHGGEAEQLDEVLQVAGVGAVRGPGEPVVAAGQQLHTAPVHLAQARDRGAPTPSCTRRPRRRPAGTRTPRPRRGWRRAS